MIAAIHHYGRLAGREVTATGFAFILMVGFCFASEPTISSGRQDGWKQGSTRGGVTLFSRVRAGSAIKEFKATGTIDAPTTVVHRVLDDFENYSAFMPYVAECRLLRREGDSLIAYQRLSPKIVSDRDYTLRVRAKSWSGERGVCFLDRWEPANELGPAEKSGVMRVKICEGGWLLEPDGPKKTRGTYSIYTDSGGTIPPFIANKISEIGIRQLFNAVRKQASKSKYGVGQ